MAKNVVLCGANSYRQTYYFNPDFNRLPEEVKKELKAMCVLFTEEAGGILTLEYEADGALELKVCSDDSDYLFDEIESELQIRRCQKEKRQLFEALELYYRLAFLGERP